MSAPPPPSSRSAAENATAVLAGALALGAVAAHLAGVARASVDVPLLDDWDVVVGFPIYWYAAEGWPARLRLLFDPHNEHLLALPRTAVLAVIALAGRIDFRWLDLLGNACGPALLLALWCGFRRRRPLAERLPAFAPAVLFVAQPQAWTAVISPTVSLSNLGVLALAAGCFALLASDLRARVALAGALALAACFCSANGILAGPLAAAVPFVRGQRRLAGAWLGVWLVLAAVYLAAAPGDHAAADPLASLATPGRLAGYVLHFVGAAGGFGRPLPALLVGAGVCAGFAALAWRGALRRSPVCMTLAGFVLASIAANALLRAHQGADAPLFQPRYALYSALLLALGHLAWVDAIGAPAARRHYTHAALAVSLAFWCAAFATGTASARSHAAELERGLASWWETGGGGLRHPDPRKAAFFLREALGAGLLALPPSFDARYGVVPVPGELPAARAQVEGALDAFQQRRGWLVVLGHARLGAASGAGDAQQVEIALVSGAGQTFLAPARSVAAPARGSAGAPAAQRPAATGYHALVDARGLPPGSYRLGVVVQQGERRHFAWTGAAFDLPGER